MSKGKEWTGYYMAVNGIQANKNYMQFKSLLEAAIANAPSTVKFTSPDIEALQKENEKLRVALEKLNDDCEGEVSCYCDEVEICGQCLAEESLSEAKGRQAGNGE